ncbi:class II fructose-1,6-bisphosphate aldolase [Patescibacteria group bacterium]|nr:MAG: class II fructose-1,6-bisphosphate aldolase [Patescibacteria group bacterium]
MLTALAPVLQKAHRGRYAVGAFNINNLELAQGIMAAAEKLRAPVILQTSEGAIDYAGMEYLAAIAWVAAERVKTPVVFHLDHGKNPSLVERAIKSGFYTSVMIDGSHHPYKENVRVTKKIVAMAHRRGVSVEAELGAIAGIEDFVSVAERDARLTNPEEARRFVRETGCDALAVAIGTAHGVFKFKGAPKLDIPRLRKIKAATKLPLVLHGASGVDPKLRAALKDHCDDLHDCNRVKDARGVSDALIRQAVRAGINKINIDSDLRLAFTAAVRSALMKDVKTVDPRKVVGPARDAVTDVVMGKMTLFGCARKG